MSGVWHPLRHTPSWREKLTTRLHVVLRFRMSGVCHPLRHTPSWREKLTTHLHVVLRFRMSGVWHPLRHTPSWCEKLSTHLHVVLRFRMNGVWHPLRHTPSWCAQGKRFLPSALTERSMLAGMLVATAALLQRISLWEQRSSQRLFPCWDMCCQPMPLMK